MEDIKALTEKFVNLIEKEVNEFCTVLKVVNAYM